MNYNFEYIDIILLAMIAGFIFLRLRGILGRRTGFENNVDTGFSHDLKAKKNIINELEKIDFNDEAKNEFLNGAKIAYETIITNFAKGNLKNIKSLLDKRVFEQFNEAIRHRKEKELVSNTTFVGINSALIKEHKNNNNILEVTVDFVSEIISCVKDKDNKILSGDPEKVKKVYDTWRFSKNLNSNDPNWVLVETNI